MHFQPENADGNDVRFSKKYLYFLCLLETDGLFYSLRIHHECVLYKYDYIMSLCFFIGKHKWVLVFIRLDSTHHKIRPPPVTFQCNIVYSNQRKISIN